MKCYLIDVARRYAAKAFFLSMLVVLATSPAQAREIIVAGLGTKTCAQFASEYKRDPAHAEVYFFTWAQGAMAALNLSRDDDKYSDLGSRSVVAQEADIRMYCDTHPLAPYWNAVVALYRSFPVKPLRLLSRKSQIPKNK